MRVTSLIRAYGVNPVRYEAVGSVMNITLASNIARSNLALRGSLRGWNGRTQVTGCHWVD